MVTNVYILGNFLFEEDSTPVNLTPKLQSSLPQFKFQHLDPTENLPEEENLILIDTIIDINEVKILNEEDIDKIENSPQYSLHDFDLGFQLKLMKKMGKIKKVTIIGVPTDMEEEKAIQQIKKLLMQKQLL